MFFCAPGPTPIPPYFGGVPLNRITAAVVNLSRYLKSYSDVKLFLQYSNVCKKIVLDVTDTQTDRQTDDILWHNCAVGSIAR